MRGIAFCLRQSALWRLVGQEDQATIPARLEESLRLSREVGDQDGMALHACIAGQVAFYGSDLVTAQALEEQSLALSREIEDRWLPIVALIFLGKIAAQRGDFTAAHTLHEESLRDARVFQDHWATAYSLEGLAQTMAAQGATAWAAHLWGAAAALRERCGIPLLPIDRVDYESALAAARLHLGEQAFAAAWAEGRNMTIEQVLVAPQR